MAKRSVDYLPLDLRPFHNAGADVLGDGTPLIGERSIRGIPFHIGTDPRRCFLAIDSTSAPIAIPVGRSVRRVLFAHRLFDPRPEDLTAADGDPGGAVAHWVVRRTNGRTERVTLREHFEVANIPSRRKLWLATDDRPISLAPRHTGRWLDHFARQQEVQVPGARDYYLWDWIDPDPSSAISALEVEPAGRRYLVAAITLSFVDEDPFPRSEARAIRITLANERDARTDVGLLEVDVDRGAATYPYPLPRRLVDPGPPGWGEPAIREAGCSYVKVQAAPSATVRVRRGEIELASFRW